LADRGARHAVDAADTARHIGTVDLSGYPDLVVIILGMRVNMMTGLRTLLGFGPKIESAARARPPGLLHHEAFLFSLLPAHAGIRQYWQDFESLERWARSEPHRVWWKEFLKDSQGTGFWHETYPIRTRRHSERPRETAREASDMHALLPRYLHMYGFCAVKASGGPLLNVSPWR
jgi:hypothetical protein